MNPWIPYQPARAREKEFYDIRLRDGTELEACWPNGVHWTYGGGGHPRPIADYRVTHIRLTEDWLEKIENRPLPGKGTVLIIDAP